MCGKQIGQDQYGAGQLGGNEDFFADRAEGKQFFQIHADTSNL